MADNLSDTQIRADLRSLLAESGIDPNQTSLVCASGSVRVFGHLKGIHEAPVHPRQVDNLELSMRRSRGVTRVHMNVDNWERQPNGEWKPIEPLPPASRRDPRERGEH